MTRELAGELRQQQLERHGSIASEDLHSDTEDGTETDSDDGWLAEEDGRLVPAKNTLRIRQLQEHEA